MSILLALYLLDTDAAPSYVLGNAYDYPKPNFVRDSLREMTGGDEGLLVVEGDVHRRQRKILTPAFSAGHIKSLLPIFWEKGVQVCGPAEFIPPRLT